MKPFLLSVLSVSVLTLGCNSPVETASSKPIPELSVAATDPSLDQKFDKFKYVSNIDFRNFRNFSAAKQVSLKIMDPITARQRQEKYEKPLSETLKNKKLGILTSISRQLKNGEVESVGIGIYSDDPPAAIEALSEALREIGAPKGSQFTRRNEDKKLIVTPVWDEDSADLTAK